MQVAGKINPVASPPTLKLSTEKPEPYSALKAKIYIYILVFNSGLN